MRIILKNQKSERTFIVKIKYDETKPNVIHTKDKFGRNQYTIWTEHKTTVTSTEWDPVKEPVHSTVYVGTAKCNYQDKYNKQYGKQLAWKRCVDEMIAKGVISEIEGSALAETKLTGCVLEINIDKLVTTTVK